MTGSARTCFLAMLIAETLILGLLFLGVRLGFADLGPYFAEARNWPLVPSENVDFAVQVMLPLSILGLLLLWGGLWALPAKAWPHGKHLRTGLLFSFLPVLPVFATEILDWPGRAFSTFGNWAGLVSGLVLFAWLLVHPVGFAKETWRSGQTGLCIAWTSIALAPVLATLLWLSAPALLWDAGLAFLAVRLAVAVATVVAWRPRSSTSLRSGPPPRPTTRVFGWRARTCWLAMLVAEALLVGFLSLDPWMDEVETQRYIATSLGRPIPTNAFFDFIHPLGWRPLALGILLLGIAIGAFPKKAWPHGEIVRTGLLASSLLPLALLGTQAVWDGEALYTLSGWAWALSSLTLLAWLVFHPLQMATEAKRRGQSTLSIGWAIVGLATPLILFLSVFELSDTVAITLTFAVVSLGFRLGLGTATAVAWRSRPLAGGAS